MDDRMPDPARSSEAAPSLRRPGEATFAAFFVTLSLVMLWAAHDISGFAALSAPGSVPMATTLVMAVTSILVLARTLRRPADPAGSLRRDVLPAVLLIMAGMLLGYALLLRPFGFLPTSALFLIAAIKLLSRRGWGFTLATSLGSLLAIYLVFRIVFTVLMPAGIVPEGQMIQWFRDLIPGGRT